MIDERKYVESQSMATGPVTNRNLVCRSCVYRNDDMPTAHCNVYKRTQKPDAVLLGMGCPMYRRK